MRIYTSISKANISNGNEGKLEMWRGLCVICTSNRILQLMTFTFSFSSSSSSFCFIVINVMMMMMTKKCRWRWLKNKKASRIWAIHRHRALALPIIIIRCNQASNCFFQQHYQHFSMSIFSSTVFYY